MSSLSTIALQGIHSNLAAAQQHSADVIAGFSTGEPDPVQAIVALWQDLQATKASARLIRADQRLQQAVLDILA